MIKIYIQRYRYTDISIDICIYDYSLKLYIQCIFQKTNSKLQEKSVNMVKYIYKTNEFLVCKPYHKEHIVLCTFIVKFYKLLNKEIILFLHNFSKKQVNITSRRSNLEFISSWIYKFLNKYWQIWCIITELVL